MIAFGGSHPQSTRVYWRIRWLYMTIQPGTQRPFQKCNASLCWWGFQIHTQLFSCQVIQPPSWNLSILFVNLERPQLWIPPLFGRHMTSVAGTCWLGPYSNPGTPSGVAYHALNWNWRTTRFEGNSCRHSCHEEAQCLHFQWEMPYFCSQHLMSFNLCWLNDFEFMRIHDSSIRTWFIFSVIWNRCDSAAFPGSKAFEFIRLEETCWNMLKHVETTNVSNASTKMHNS